LSSAAIAVLGPIRDESGEEGEGNDKRPPPGSSGGRPRGCEDRPLQQDPARLTAESGLSDVAFRQPLSRLCDRFRTGLRAQITETLRPPDEGTIDDEL